VSCEATWGKCGGLQPLYEGLQHGGSEGVEFGDDGVDGRHYW